MAIYTGIDPSISCTGIALVEYDIESNSFKLLDKKSISPSGKLRGYYRSAEAFELFKQMLSAINKDVSTFLLNGKLPVQDPNQIQQQLNKRQLK